MLYQIHNGVVAYGAEVILHDINFEVRNNEKIAVVGRNGCGKTTLLKLINGELDIVKRTSDEDMYIAKANNLEIGYLKQMAFANEEVKLIDEVHKAFDKILSVQDRMNNTMEKLDAASAKGEDTEELAKEYSKLQERFEFLGGYDYEREADMVLTAFGFGREEREKKLNEFSGGQKTKIAFAKLLLSKPDILLLDEPTNHLDINAVTWLEGYIKNYKSAVIIVSHDRMFLDNVSDVVYEIEYGTAKRYPGNYSDFVKRKKEDYEKQLKDYKLQQKEIERLQYMVDKNKNHPSHVAMAWSKQKAIDRMDKIEAPDRYDLRSFHVNCTPKTESVKRVLTVKDLQIGYDHVLSTVNFELTKGRKLAVIGANGTGKSTLLKTIMDIIPGLGGEVSFGERVEPGYFDQQIAQYSSEKTVLDDMWDEFPTMNQTEVRTLLGSFLFSGDDVFKQVSMLSGGEKGRLALAKLFKRQPNFILLDEPTNHMDIVGKETLESMLKAYTGTILFVSHDRYLVKNVADSLLIFEPDRVVYYPYDYSQYLEDMAKKNDASTGFGLPAAKSESLGQIAVTAKESVKTEFAAKTNVNVGKEKSRITRKIEKIENQIFDIEADIEEAKESLLNPDYATDYQKLSEIQAQIDKDTATIEGLMFEWNELDTELKALDEQ